MMDLESCILSLARFGEPILMKLKAGWHVELDCFVAGAGLSVRVKSESRHETPLAAALECLERLHDVIRTSEEMKKTLSALEDR